MKKFLIATALALTTFAANPSFSIDNKAELSAIKILECKNGQCTATAKSTGLRCKNCCQKNSYYCSSHK